MSEELNLANSGWFKYWEVLFFVLGTPSRLPRNGTRQPTDSVSFEAWVATWGLSPGKRLNDGDHDG